MELFLLLELEDARRLDGEHILDVVEDGVVVLDVEGAADEELRPEATRHLEGLAHGLVAVRRSVDAHDPSPAGQRPVVADQQQILLDAASDAGSDPAHLRQRLDADAVRPHDEKVVVAARASCQLLLELLVLGDEPAVLADPDIAAHSPATIVSGRDVRVEADQAGEAAAALVRLPDDLLVVDALEELPGHGHIRFFAP